MPSKPKSRAHKATKGRLLKSKAELGDLLQQGLAQHRTGNLHTAMQMYQKILAIEPRHPDATQLLATCEFQSGNYARAVQLFDAALELNPQIAAAYNNRGIALKKLGRPDEALESYAAALRIEPNYADAHLNRGNLLLELNRAVEGLASYAEAIRIRPDFAEVHFNKGNALKNLKRHEEALESYTETLRIRPDYPEAQYNRGNVLLKLKRWDEALTSYAEAIRVRPHYAEAYNNLGNALKALLRYDEALESYTKAHQIKPDFAEAYNNCGTVFLERGRLDKALESYAEALRLRPAYPEALYNRGNVLLELGRLEEALTSYAEAIRAKPDYAEAHCNRGVTLNKLGRPDEALMSLEEALRIWPEYADAYCNRGVALKELKRFNEALQSFEDALRLKPDWAEANWNRSILLLLLGDFLEGWRLYEWRLSKAVVKARYYQFTQPAWRGQAGIENQRLLLYAEQGFGDALQFVRYLPMVKETGAEIILEIPGPLVSTVSSLKVQMTIIPKGAALPEFDVHCPLMSLPHAFKTTVETIPGNTPYLFADPDKVALWQRKLGPRNCPRIGLVWSGSKDHNNDHNRSIPLVSLSPLFGLPLEWHSLQKEYRSADEALLSSHPWIHQHQEALADFSDTAALIECMDLVITVDTSAAHLAGALNKQVWILLPFAPDYRWLLDREDTPWYPSARLFRQPQRGDWAGVIQNVETALLSIYDSTS